MSNAGMILRVDLTNNKIEKQPTSDYIKDYIGGYGIGTKILWDGVPPNASGLDPENMLIISTGPLTGTLLGNRSIVVTKSPMFTNYTMATAGMGGQFPSEMKFAGYDHIVVTGKSEKPVYLFVYNDEVEIRDATHLWGMDVYETQTTIKEELKDLDTKVACIGPAGENLYAYSLLLHDIDNTASKGGYGAVMGSKRLKAIAVRGTKGLRIARPDEFMEMWKQYYEYYFKGDGRYFLKSISEGVGIGDSVDNYLKRDLAVWGNFDSFVVPTLKKEEEMSGFVKYLVGRNGCAFCPTQCHQLFDAYGVSGGLTCGGYVGFRWVVKSKDLEMWWKLNQLCQRYGMDFYSTAGMTAWLMDLYEQGIITAADTDGVPMEWGSEEACRTVMEKIARREGFGELLMDGIVPAAQRIGRNSIKLAVQSRNNVTFPGFAPIGGAVGVQMMTGSSEVWLHPTAADMDSFYLWLAPEMGVSEEEAERLIKEKASDFAEKKTGDRDSWREDHYETYADYAVVNETAIAACEISGHCDWLSDRIPHLGGWWGPEENAQAISAATGMNCTGEMLTDAHRRRRLLELAYHQLCVQAFGIKDSIPLKLVKPRPDGYYKGATFDLGKAPMVIKRYCELMGIDPETLLPLRSELERLGMSDVADYLERLDSKDKSAEAE
ncbi:aldehyde ferredoxin oxidoreductase N-terminal domain-containing protein [Chloroflexota bacterium]